MILVGVRGFEPPTTTTPLWCATGLRYTPSLGRNKYSRNFIHPSRFFVFSSIYATQFTVVPGDYLQGLHEDDYTFARLGLNHGPCRLVEWSCVAFPDHLAYTLNRSAIIGYHCLTLDLHAAQFIIALACLYKTGKHGITPQVDRFLRPGICPEGNLVVDQYIPHRHQVRKSIVI